MSGNDPSLSVRSFGQPPARILPGLQAYYRVLYEDRGGTTIRDLSGKNRTKATVNGTAPAWVGGFGDMIAVHLPGTDEYIEFKDNLFDGATQGTIVVLVKAPSDSLVALVDTLSGAGRAIALYAAMPNDAVFLGTDFGGPAETFGKNGAMVWDEWLVIGAEWGLQGKSLYSQGAFVGTNAIQTGAAGTTGTAPYCGRENVTYAEVDFAAMLYWDRHLGIAEHRWLDQWLRFGN